MPKKKILVVDDEPDLRTLLQRILEAEEFDVIAAPDGNTALSLLEEHKPDLIILDIVMPGLDGFQTLGLIRERSDVPVIMLTGKYDAAALDYTLALGADDYIRKPFKPAEIVARVKAKLRLVERAKKPPASAES